MRQRVELARALAGQSATITVTGVASKGAALGTAAAVPLQFAPEDIAGGVYYFSPSTRGIKRAPIGAKRAVDFVVNGAETGCAGCHAVSRDGKQVAIEFGSGATSVGSTVVSGSRAAVRNFALQPAEFGVSEDIPQDTEGFSNPGLQALSAHSARLDANAERTR